MWLWRELQCLSVDISSKNYFELFSLQPAFRFDDAQLSREFQALQARYHPDRFSAAGDSERLQALQASSILNEAYNTLKSPLKRAAYLLTLQGMEPERHEQSALDADFLLQQIQWRDQLEMIAGEENPDALDELKARVRAVQKSDWQVFEKQFSEQAYAEAKAVYHRLQFIEKLLHEIDLAEDKLLGY